MRKKTKKPAETIENLGLERQTDCQQQIYWNKYYYDDDECQFKH